MSFDALDDNLSVQQEWDAVSGTYEPSEMEHLFGVSAHSSGEGEDLPAEEAVVVPAGLDEVADREAPQLFRPVSPELPWELDSVRAIFGDLGRHLSPELPSLAGAWGLVGGANDVAPTIPRRPKQVHHNLGLEVATWWPSETGRMCPSRPRGP